MGVMGVVSETTTPEGRRPMGKGDKRRPSYVEKKVYDENFEAVFGRKELKTWDPEGEAGGANRPEDAGDSGGGGDEAEGGDQPGGEG
jgi:hypothetical protein